MVKFRIAKVSDIKEIYEVMLSAYFISAFYKNKEKDEVIKSLKKDFFDKKEIIVVVGTLWNKIMCYSIIGPYKKYKKKGFPRELRNFAYSLGTGVLENHRGKGIGTKLRKFMDKVAQKKGYKGIYTDVSSKNKISLKVQEKTGFTKVAEHKGKRKSIIFRKEF